MNTQISRPLALVILDGWGVSPGAERNAIKLAHTPYFDDLASRFPYTTLKASGESVGLAPGSAGNAEAGHLNLGAGRVVRSDAKRIADSISSGEFFSNPVLAGAMQGARSAEKNVHLVGLLSDGGVHSSSGTLYALLVMARRERIENVFVHGILDGRDVHPRTADVFVEALEIKMNEIGVGRIATLCGRYYSMDTTENWGRTARAFTMLVHGEGERVNDAVTGIRSSYLRGIADEFVAPIVLESEPDMPFVKIADGDTVIFFNHRAESMRQLVRAVALPDLGETPAIKPRLNVVCMTEYDSSFNLPAAFRREVNESGLGATLASLKVPSVRIAEQDRIIHVTNFIDGRPIANDPYQKNVKVGPAAVSVFEAEPEMGSFKVADQLLEAIETEPSCVFVANLSAAGLISEAGDLNKTVEAVQFIDTCLGGIVEAVHERGGMLVVTSTHGSCEETAVKDDKDGNIKGTQNDVPFILADRGREGLQLRPNGSLIDVAPTILELLDISMPGEMEGSSLLA